MFDPLAFESLSPIEQLDNDYKEMFAVLMAEGHDPFGSKEVNELSEWHRQECIKLAQSTPIPVAAGTGDQGRQDLTYVDANKVERGPGGGVLAECVECREVFERPVQRGRPAVRCEACRN